MLREMQAPGSNVAALDEASGCFLKKKLGVEMQALDSVICAIDLFTYLFLVCASKN